MVSAVRRGATMREVARRFGVTLRTVQRWVRRATGRRLDRVDWADRPSGARPSPRRTAVAVEQAVLELRRELRESSLLGEYGAAAVRAALSARGGIEAVPSERTVARILVRHGAVDRGDRVRRPAPPPGWHLPTVAAGAAELDSFDVIEDLKLAGGPLFDVLTAVSVRGGLPGAWPLERATTDAILPCLAAHWQVHGCPAYAQFDNDTRFQGAHTRADIFGRVIRFCLQLGVTPVFAPPYEFGLQNAVEHFNGLFAAKVWRRAHFTSVAECAAHAARYVAALRARRAGRLAEAPPRAPWPVAWEFRPQTLPAGVVVFIRRASVTGHLTILGRNWSVGVPWAGRLVRAEVDLGAGEVRCVGLRRRAPDAQPLLAVLRYRYPRADLEPDAT